jgi:uncharacterized protein (TIGR03437 family)
MRTLRIGALATWLLVSCSAQIAAVVNAASGLPIVVPGTLITIYGTGLAPDGCASSAPSLPWPYSLCNVSVGFNLDSYFPLNLQVSYVSPTQINAYFPVPQINVAAPGTGIGASPINVVWRVGNSGFDSSYPTAGFLVSGEGAPGVFVSGLDCTLFDPAYPALGACPASEKVFRGAITDLSGKLISQANPATINEYLIVWAGAAYASYKAVVNGATVTVGFADQAMSLYQPSALQIGSVSIPMPMTNQSLSVPYLGPSIYPGVDQLNVMISSNSANFPCGVDTKLEADLGFTGFTLQQTNRVKLPILVKAAQVPCKP